MKILYRSHTLTTVTICVAILLPQLPCLSKAVSGPHRGVQPASSASSVSASFVTGSYERDLHREYSGNLEVQEMPGGRIKFQLSLLGNLSDPGGPNMGETDGIVQLQTAHHQTTAIYQSSDGRIAMRFYGRKVIITQYGEMDYGLGVGAGGTYTRKSKKPDFDSSINQ